MKKIIAALSLMASTFSFAQDHDAPKTPEIIGRWDITVDEGHRIIPSWLEVNLSGIRTLVGHFVAEGGSARPISEVNFDNGKVSFTIPPQWDRTNIDLIFNGQLKDGKITGTIRNSRGETHPFVAERAPLLNRTAPTVWGTPIKLFNGKDLKGWHTQRPDNQWVVENGIMKSPRSGSNIMTDQTFNDFKLHIEVRYPKGSNSGIYLRGRYEVQVEDSYGREPDSHLFGGVYGFLTPNQMAVKPAGEWQVYDITLIGRRVTVVANGKTIISDQIIPGITGGAIDSKEGLPGPIFLQGDHGPVEYRNIVITPAK